jgi:8-amino-7-oxononanoate synthase
MSSPERLERRIRQELDRIETEGLRRRLSPPFGIDLSSNDYLQLATHPGLARAMANAALEEGCGSTGSRLLRGERESFRHIEQRFAQFKHAEASLYFGSGYAANLGVLGTFIGRTDLVFSDERNHASILDGIQLAHARRVKFPHCDAAALARLLRAAPRDAQRFIVTESLFSMDGDFAPLADYAALARETGAALIVDEAHAVGVYGARGSGLVEENGVNDGVFITVNTAGKALGVVGAFVAGPSWAIDYLVQRARPFLFSTAPPPPLAAALDASLTLIENEPARRAELRRKAELLGGLLAERSVARPTHSQIIPIVLGANDRATAAAAELQREGFDVRAIRPPSVPEGEARLRVSVNIGLDDEVLRRFASSVAMKLSVSSFRGVL